VGYNGTLLGLLNDLVMVIWARMSTVEHRVYELVVFSAPGGYALWGRCVLLWEQCGCSRSGRRCLLHSSSCCVGLLHSPLPTSFWCFCCVHRCHLVFLSSARYLHPGGVMRSEGISFGLHPGIEGYCILGVSCARGASRSAFIWELKIFASWGCRALWERHIQPSSGN